jgi:hypothetical protein
MCKMKCVLIYIHVFCFSGNCFSQLTEYRNLYTCDTNFSSVHLMDKLVNDSTSIKIPSYGEESEIKVNDYMVLDVFSSVDQTSGICEEQICFINDYIQKDDFKCLEDSMALALIHFSNHDSIILEQFAESKSQRLSLLSKELLFSLKVLNADYPDTYLDFEPILDSLLQESLKYIDKGYRCGAKNTPMNLRKLMFQNIFSNIKYAEFVLLSLGSI